MGLMPEAEHSFDDDMHFKSVAVQYFFVEPADINYLLARQCRIFGIYPEFYWQSLQAIEKYLKGALLLNEISYDRKSHKICELATKLQSGIAVELFPNLERPSNLPKHYCWDVESALDFLQRVTRQGNVDSRYGMSSTAARIDDLFKLDTVVFAFRRLTMGLEWVVGSGWPCNELEMEYIGKTYRELLLMKPASQLRKWTEFPKIRTSIAGENLSDFLTAWNYLLGADRAHMDAVPPYSVMPSFGPIRNSFLDWNLSGKPYEGKELETMARGWHWIRVNIPVPKDAINHFDGVYGTGS